jgi:hypothetical protein
MFQAGRKNSPIYGLIWDKITSDRLKARPGAGRASLAAPVCLEGCAVFPGVATGSQSLCVAVETWLGSFDGTQLRPLEGSSCWWEPVRRLIKPRGHGGSRGSWGLLATAYLCQRQIRSFFSSKWQQLFAGWPRGKGGHWPGWMGACAGPPEGEGTLPGWLQQAEG